MGTQITNPCEQLRIVTQEHMLQPSANECKQRLFCTVEMLILYTFSMYWLHTVILCTKRMVINVKNVAQGLTAWKIVIIFWYCFWSDVNKSVTHQAHWCVISKYSYKMLHTFHWHPTVSPISLTFTVWSAKCYFGFFNC